ncbi:MAG TPA: tetratricopeptide repeat protein [Bryobacteraceae bacterium]|nr:tetratricopeptide repeat protein [Bryobacteraceae bacterium]
MKRAAPIFALAVSVCFCQAPRPASAPAASGNAGAAAAAEALWKAGNFEGANNAFKALVAANPQSAPYRVRWGQLFAERFSPGEAVKLYEEALAIDPKYAPAYLHMAEVFAEEYNSKAKVAADKALELDPKLYQAHELKARMALEDDDLKAATEETDKALAIEPTALNAIAVRAAMDLLADRESSWLGKIANRGKGYELIAHLMVINRRYEDGIAYYRKAIAAEPSLWSAHAQLGVNLMRLAREEEARAELEIAYENHYRDAATVNSLRLMDTYKDFQTFTTPTTILKLNKKEAGALHYYVETEMQRAMAVYEKKYQFKLKRPVQVEVYPNHEDFAVRTMGLPGLGALGVTFNDVVAMDSPSGRPPGQFHWASTLWHEMSHVYILTLTNYRVPRWFTEGVAVHEETATVPDWGDRITPGVIAAIRDKKLLPVAQIDRGFVHPSYPEQVIVSYYQAGKICDYIAARWGEKKLLDIALQFAKNRPTAAVLKEQLGMETEAFDKDFLAQIDKETAVTVQGFEGWTKGLSELNKMSREASPKHDEIITKGRELEKTFPDYIEAGNAYVVVAQSCMAKGDKACALEEYGKYSAHSGREASAIKSYAKLLDENGKKKEAEAALERLNFVNPLDQDLHIRLGELYLSTKDGAKAAREFSALIALNPIDVAGSHYNLARAYNAEGQKDKAREEAFTALEAAPDFRPAQKLLLELSGESPNK